MAPTPESNLGFDSCSLGTGYCMNAGSGGAQYGLPSIKVAAPYSGLGDGLFAPLFDYNNTFQYQGSLTWTHGAHNVKTGASLIRRQLNLQQSQSARGSYSVNGTFTGSALGDLVAGYASDAQFQNDVAFPRFRSWEVAGYIQDDWRVTRWLALNLGVRYEIFTPFTEVHGDISNFDTATGEVVSPILSGVNHGIQHREREDRLGQHLSPARLFGIAAAAAWCCEAVLVSLTSRIEIGNAALLQNVPLVISRDCGGDAAYPVACPAAIAGPGRSGAYYCERTVAAHNRSRQCELSE